jgi:hypothetical protein
MTLLWLLGQKLVQRGKRQVSNAFAVSGNEPSGGAHNLFAGYEGWVSRDGVLKVVVTQRVEDQSRVN